MVCAWYLDEEKVAEDQRNAARGSSVSLETLKKLGVEYFQVCCIKIDFLHFFESFLLIIVGW